MKYGSARIAWEACPYAPHLPRWHRERRTYVGASEVGAVLKGGAGARRVAGEKRGGKGFRGNYATRRGHYMESFILREAERQLNEPIEPVKTPLEHPAIERFRVHLDGWIPTLGVPVEAKFRPGAPGTLKRAVAALYDGIRPKQTEAFKWDCQIQTQIFVVDSDCGYLAVDFGEARLFTVRVRRDQALIDEILSTIPRWWKAWVEAETLPPEPPEKSIGEMIREDATL